MNCKIHFYFAPVVAAAFVVVPTVAVEVVVATAFVVVATKFIADTTLLACFLHIKSSVTHVEEPLQVKHD